MKKGMCLFLVLLSLWTITANGTKEVTNDQKKPETLRVMFAGNGSEDAVVSLIQNTIDTFNEDNQYGVIAEVEFIQAEQYKTKIAIEMAANNPPDVFFTWSAGFLKPYVDAGKVYPIGEALDADPEWKNRFINGIFSLLTYDGQIYAVPNIQSVVALVYNKTMFDTYQLEVPKTYEELKHVVTVLSDNGITPFALGNKQPWVGALFSEIIANRIGGSTPYDSIVSGEGSWMDRSFVEAGKVIQELGELGAYPEGVNGIDYDPSIAMMTQGKAAMMVMGSWVFPPLTAEGSLVKEDLAIANFPMFTNGVGSANAWLGQPDQNYAISQACDNKPAAIELIKRFSAAEVQREFAAGGNIIATTTSVDPAVMHPLIREVIELQKDMDQMFVFYDVGLGPVIGNEYNNAIQAIIAGNDVETTLQALQQFTIENRE